MLFDSRCSDYCLIATVSIEISFINLFNRSQYPNIRDNKQPIPIDTDLCREISLGRIKITLNKSKRPLDRAVFRC